MLEAKNKTVWYDQDAEDLSKKGMKNGVRNARNVLIFLSDGVMSSQWCRMEMRWGKQFGCGFVGLQEMDERHNAADFEKEKRLAPSDLRHLLQDYEVIAEIVLQLSYKSRWGHRVAVKVLNGLYIVGALIRACCLAVDGGVYTLRAVSSIPPAKI